MTKNTMSWIIVMLLVLIIILLSICIYLDIRFTDIFESRVPTSTVATVTTVAPSSSSTQAPTTTQQPRVTTAKPLITTKPTETTAKPLITTQPTTTAKPLVTTAPDAITTAPLTTTKAPITTQQTPITTAPITTTPITTTPITTPAVTSSSAKPDETTVPVFPNAPTICIDPGHGFSDPGALGVLNGVTYQEDDINLAIAYKLKNELNARGFNVIFTHDGVNPPEDKYLKKAEGSTFFYVNNRNAWITDRKSEIDLVVSIHCNANNDTTISGTRYYILPYDASGTSGSHPASVMLAESICDATSISLGIPSPRPKYLTQELAVLRTGIPSVLVESAFISNAGDLQKLLDEEWQTTLAQGIANGVKNYCDKYVK